MKICQLTCFVLFIISCSFCLDIQKELSNEDETYELDTSDMDIDQDTKKQFDRFKSRHGRKYKNQIDEKEHLRIFQNKTKRIKEFNKGKHSYEIGINKFIDLSPKEFQKKYLLKPSLIENMKLNMRMNFREEEYQDFMKQPEFRVEQNKLKAPAKIDWSPYILQAKDQGECGSCWAFSTTEAIQANYQIKKNVKISSIKPKDQDIYLSVQQLIDWDTSNFGCDGGVPPYALDYVKKAGISLNKTYPYIGKKNRKPLKFQKYLTISDKLYCDNFYETKTTNCQIDGKWEALLSKGPIIVSVDGSVLQDYTSGIIDTKCSDENHAVLAVGSGVDEAGVKYIKVLNSWGTDWGENGYFRIKDDPKNNNSCFIKNCGYLPTFK